MVLALVVVVPVVAAVFAATSAIVGRIFAATDERPVYVDVVEDREPEVVGCGVLTLVEDDRDAPHGQPGDVHESAACVERVEDAGTPAKADPPDAPVRHDGRWRVAADEVGRAILGCDVEAGSARATVGSSRIIRRGCGHRQPGLAKVVPQLSDDW